MKPFAFGSCATKKFIESLQQPIRETAARTLRTSGTAFFREFPRQFGLAAERRD